jgi:hypothetical protein
MIWIIILAIINAVVLAFSARALAHETDNPLARYVWLLMGMIVLWMATFGIWRIFYS